MRRGTSLVEVVVVLALLALAILVFVPAAADLAGDAGASAAAREMAVTLHALRWRSVAENRGHGMWFQRDGTGWYWYLVRDENGNGLRTAEMRSGRDRILSGPHRLGESVQGMRVGFPDVPWLPDIPPRRGRIVDLDDPIRFGRADLISFSPLGTATSGTLFLTDGRHELRAVVVFGPTVRIRVWRYDSREGIWKL